MEDCGGNGQGFSARLAAVELEAARNASRLHILERDVCASSFEAKEQATRAADRIDALAGELARFETAMADALNRLRDDILGALKKAPIRKRLLARWFR